MPQVLDPLLILALAINFFALGVSSLRAVTRAVGLQGALVGILAPFVHPEIDLRGFLLVGAIIGLKGVAIPALLLHAMREVSTRHEVNPHVSYIASLLLGAVGTGLALVFSATLPLAREHAGLLLVPAALSTVLTGFLLLTTRQKAVMQVLGFLLLDNGIFLFGLLLLGAMPFLVEAGMLLDLFAGVFVMGIIIHHINREFDSVNTERLSELKD
jgi:hydrogenase-4 component E